MSQIYSDCFLIRGETVLQLVPKIYFETSRDLISNTYYFKAFSKICKVSSSKEEYHFSFLDKAENSFKENEELESFLSSMYGSWDTKVQFFCYALYSLVLVCCTTLEVFDFISLLDTTKTGFASYNTHIIVTFPFSVLLSSILFAFVPNVKLFGAYVVPLTTATNMTVALCATIINFIAVFWLILLLREEQLENMNRLIMKTKLLFLRFRFFG